MKQEAAGQDSSREPRFSRIQEIGNAISHGLGAALAIPALVMLVVQAAHRGTAWHVVSYTIFGASMLLLYLASTLYHAFQEPGTKRVFEILDHSAIYVLIAGSYTAFALTILRSESGWWLFGAVWVIAALGIAMEVLFLNRWPSATLAVYLAMGWLITLVWKPFILATPRATVVLVIAGGLSYTFGTIFYALSQRRGWFHIGWHFFVIGGTTCHFFAALAALPRV